MGKPHCNPGSSQESVTAPGVLQAPIPAPGWISGSSFGASQQNSLPWEGSTHSSQAQEVLQGLGHQQAPLGSGHSHVEQVPLVLRGPAWEGEEKIHGFGEQGSTAQCCLSSLEEDWSSLGEWEMSLPMELGGILRCLPSQTIPGLHFWKDRGGWKSRNLQPLWLWGSSSLQEKISGFQFGGSQSLCSLGRELLIQNREFPKLDWDFLLHSSKPGWGNVYGMGEY